MPSVLVSICVIMQAVFLGDLGRNLRSAREVGMVTVRVRETEEALRELETLLGVRLVEEKRENSPYRREIDNYRSKL